jgi:hypothetical protein
VKVCAKLYALVLEKKSPKYLINIPTDWMRERGGAGGLPLSGCGW